MRLRALCALAAGSGFCALVYQTMWFRALRTVFGASTPANAAVLAIFMAGLGVGGALLGRRVERAPSPLAFYARLEFGIALSAALSPFLVDAVRAAYLATGGSSSLGAAGATVVRILLSAIAIGAPAFLMGGTYPALARAAADDGDVTRRGLALIYGVNTLGAVAGVALTTFFLLDLFGVHQSIWCAALVNALVALAARSLARSAPSSSSSSSSSRSSSSSPPPSRARLLLAAAFATGFAFFLLELVWYRMGAPLLGGSTYSFGVVLALALLGTGAGGALYAVAGPREATPARFALTCALEALLLLVPLGLGDGVAYLAFHLRELGEASFGALSLTWVAIAGVLVLPAALVAGYQFPLLLALKGRGAGHAGKDSGDLYAANTAGAIAGSLVGGFGALPALSAPGAWRLAALVLVVAGVAFALASWRAERARSSLALAIGAAAIAVAVFAAGPSAVWRHTPIGAGRADLHAATWNQRMAKSYDMQRLILDSGDGVESSVAFRVGHHGVALIVGGKSDGATLGDAATQIGLGLVPALLHGDVKRAFVVGIGTGQTAGFLGRLPGIERVDVAEIEPRVLRFAELCADTNGDMPHNDKVHVILGDGREALMTSSTTYDLVVSEPSNPYRAGVSSFYARELYEAAYDKLADDGVFAQWVQSYEVEPAAVQTAVATMASVFPDVSAWRLLPGDMLLVATKRPAAHDAQVLDVARIRADLAREPYRTAFDEVLRVSGVEGLAALHQASPALLARLARGAPALNTDDRPVLELSFARSVGRGFDSPLDALLALARPTGDDLPRATAPLDRALVEAQRARPFIAVGLAPDASVAAAADPVEVAWARGDFGGARMAAGAAPPRVDDPFARLIRADVLARTADDSAAADDAAAALATRLPCDAAWLALDAALSRPAADDSAVTAAAPRAFDAARADPWCSRPLERAVFAHLRQAPLSAAGAARVMDALLAARFAGYGAEIERLDTAHALAQALPAPPPPSCVALYGAVEPYPRWELTWLRGRAACYERHAPERFPAARADLLDFLSHRTATLGDLLADPAPP